MVLTNNYLLLIPILILSFILFNFHSSFVYAQNNSPFVTKSQLESALANVVTQEQLESALANVVTQEDLNERFYVVNGPLIVGDVFPPPDLLISTAECDDGDIVITGGFSIQYPPNRIDTFTGIGSLSTEPLPTFDGWTSSIFASSAQSISTTALCFDNT